jgi:hypothetical protein
MYPPIHQVHIDTDQLHVYIYACIKLTLFKTSRLDENYGLLV